MSVLYMCVKLMNLGGTGFFGFFEGTGGGVQRYFERSRNILLLAWPLAEFLPSTSAHKVPQPLAQTSHIVIYTHLVPPKLDFGFSYYVP